MLKHSNYIHFFFNDPATTEIYTLSLHDALPIFGAQLVKEVASKTSDNAGDGTTTATVLAQAIVEEGLKYRSEEHTSELQSRPHLVCRLLLEKKKLIQIG